MSEPESANDERKRVIKEAIEQQMAVHDALEIERDRCIKLRRERDLAIQRAEHYAADLAIANSRAQHAEQQVAAFRAQFDVIATTHANMADMIARLRDEADRAPYAPLANTMLGRQDDGEPIPKALRAGPAAVN